MRLSAYHILRVGMGITFAWLGILIIQNPENFAGLVEPWARNIMPMGMNQVMTFTGAFDIIIGIWLISAIRIWIPAALAALHLLAVLIVTTGGIDSVIIRDIGLFAASLALAIDARNNG